MIYSIRYHPCKDWMGFLDLGTACLGRSDMVRLVRPIRLGPYVEVWEARYRGRRVLARRFPPGPRPPGWPPPPDPAVLKAMRHPRLQQYQAEVRDELGAQAQIFLLREGRTLAELLKSDGPLAPAQCLKVLREAASGLAWLHSGGPLAPRLHGDPSSGNLLLDDAGHCLWLDVLGLKPGLKPGGPGVVFGTLRYLAPEVLRGHAPTEASEVFSLGVVILESAIGTLPWTEARSPSEVLAAHGRVAGKDLVPENWQPLLTTLLRAMLSKNPKRRPSMTQVARLSKRIPDDFGPLEGEACALGRRAAQSDSDGG